MSFSTWPVTDASLRLYFSSATILMPAVCAERLISRQPAVAVGVGEADVAQRLHAVRLHVTAIASAISASFCGVLNTQLRLRVGRIDDARRCRHRDHRRLGIGGDVDHRQRIGRDRRADDHVDLVLGDELARVGDGLGRVRPVVEHDPVDLLARRSSCGSSSNVFFSGMPSDAAGPVADSVTPIVDVGLADGGTRKATARQRDRQRYCDDIMESLRTKESGAAAGSPRRA